VAEGFENSKRTVRILKAAQAWRIFRELVALYTAEQLIQLMDTGKIKTYNALVAALPKKTLLTEWQNIGGQLILSEKANKLVSDISSGKIRSWKAVHAFYEAQGKLYAKDKLAHALAAYQTVTGISLGRAKAGSFVTLFEEALEVKRWMTEGIQESRAKDYQNSFRKMVYNSDAEMNKVMGKLSSNSFIQQEKLAFDSFQRRVKSLIRAMKA
jgi:Domain of unknown function (DUF4954)